MKVYRGPVLLIMLLITAFVFLSGCVVEPGGYGGGYSDGAYHWHPHYYRSGY